MKSREVKRLLNVTQRTLTNYISRGLLHPVKVYSNHYEYDEAEVYDLFNKGKTKRLCVTYARVSLNKQKNDLASQNERLYEFCLKNGYTINQQLQDIKSGMSFSERKSFMKLLGMVMRHEVETVVVENKDRLVRFGFELVKEVFKQQGTEIVVMSDVDNKSYEQELTDDLISIIHYYSMKPYGNRRKLHNAQKALESKEPGEE